MSENHSEFEVDKLHSEPTAFSRDSIIGIIALFAAIIFFTQAYGMTVLLVSMLGFLLLLLALVIHFSYNCHQNKGKLYIAYKEIEKRAMTQSVLRERAETELSQIQNNIQLMTFIALFSNRRDEPK